MIQYKLSGAFMRNGIKGWLAGGELLAPSTKMLTLYAHCQRSKHRPQSFNCAPFRLLTKYLTQSLPPKSPGIPLLWTASLSTQSKWPVQLAEALPFERVSLYYCLSEPFLRCSLKKVYFHLQSDAQTIHSWIKLKLPSSISQ